jgi:hypothetical protein
MAECVDKCGHFHDVNERPNQNWVRPAELELTRDQNSSGVALPENR